MKLKELLLENLSLYTIRVIIKVDKSYNRTDIFNKIRALPGVIIVEPENNDFLSSKENDTFGYSLLKVKFLAPNQPIEDIKVIKHLAMVGGETKPVQGLVKFIIKPKSIQSSN